MWDKRYSEPGYAFGTAPNDFVVSVADRIPAGRVLCLGEGEGRNAVYLAKRGHEVVAVDQSPVGLAKARELAESGGVRLETVQADLADFEIARELKRHIHEGRYHQGRSAVVQVLGFKQNTRETD
ncbi:MAG: methyltransferase domain-containing protein [Deltaproteobacteria bacterium]|nr:methyltransferase domain-containing protein [Deltaproteobacteria bacterium]